MQDRVELFVGMLECVSGQVQRDRQEDIQIKVKKNCGKVYGVKCAGNHTKRNVVFAYFMETSVRGHRKTQQPKSQKGEQITLEW